MEPNNPNNLLWNKLVEDTQHYIMQLVSNDKNYHAYNRTTFILVQVCSAWANIAPALRTTALQPRNGRHLLAPVRFPRLQSLDLSACGVPIHLSVFRNYSGLTSLCMRGYGYSCGDTVAGLTSLTHLDIGQYGGIGDATISTLVNLRHLVLRNNDMVKHITTLTRLEYLDVNANFVVDLYNIHMLPNITHLDISGTTQLHGDIFTRLPLLTTLCARGHNSLRNHMLAVLTQLTRLDIRSNDRIKPKAICALTALTWLNMRDVWKIDGTRDLTTLTSLQVLKISQLMHNGEFNISSLRYIAIDGYCAGNTDIPNMSVSVYYGVIKSITRVVNLTLNVSGIDDDIITNELGHLSQLTSLKTVRLTGGNFSKYTTHRLLDQFKTLPLTHFSCKWDPTVVIMRDGTPLPAARKYGR